MKIITCASYYGSGSSAITDLISEYDGVQSLTNYEFRFLYDPDCVSDLEFNLVQNFNRHNSGHAIKRYKQFVDYNSFHFYTKRYEPYFNNRWKEISYSYLDSLVDFSYFGYWDYDFYDKGQFFEFVYKFPLRILKKTLWRRSPEKNINLLPQEITYASHPDENQFLTATRNYVHNLLLEANSENKPFLMMDQVVPSTNISRYLRYFSDDISVVLVDRDPRDIYLNAKYVWNDNIVPRDIETFCKWFSYSRSTQSIEVESDPRILLIHFEDLIYDYDNTRDRLICQLGLEHFEHLFPMKYFNPTVSADNTQYWIKHPECSKEADVISSYLPEFLYDFPTL